eukprot:jgi/Botrbrau1/5085/Bobra.37_1s0047.1
MNTLRARCAVPAISVVFALVVEHVIAQDIDNNLSLAREYWLGQVYGLTPQAIRSNQRLAAEISNIQNTTLDAPLVNRSLLEYALPYAKLTTAAYSEFGVFEGLLNAPVNAGSESLNAEQLQQIARSDIPLGFGIWAWVFGVYDQLDKVKLLTSISSGLDGLTGWGSQCQLANGTIFGASTAYLVTFKDAPGKLGIFWRGTEAFSLRTYTETLCWWPVPLLPENGGPCPPGSDGTPCYVVSGLQQQFSRLRDLILPTWRELSGSDSPPHTVVAGGHSSGGGAAQIAALYAKKVWPGADVQSVNLASMFIGNAPFAAYIKETLGSSPLGFTYNADIFGDQLPINNPPIKIWSRSERLVFIQTDPVTLQSACYDAPRPDGLYFNLLDHFPFTYVFGIESCILHQ